jgi:PLD-like domain
MSLDVHAVAGRHAHRPGCRLIGYRGVGLAVFSMNLRVLSLESREIPPLDEFMLRYLQEGVTRSSELAALLGIEPRLIHTRLVELRRLELIEISKESSETDVVFMLTVRGKKAATNLKESVMQEITIPNLVFHGLLRKPVGLGDVKKHFLKPKETKDAGLAYVPAIPNRYPVPEEIDIKLLNRTVKGGRRKKNGSDRDIVVVKSVLKNVFTLYEPAVMLEYETLDGRRERQVAFVIDGQLREEYETAFAHSRGSEVLSGFLSPQDEPIDERIGKQAPASVIAGLGKYDDAEILASQVAAARQEVEETKVQITGTDRPDTRSQLQHQVQELEAKLAMLSQERDSRKVIYLWTAEIKQKLWEALATAKQRLLILSGWISSEVVNDEFIKALSAALSRGVKVWIGYGFDKGSKRGQDQRGMVTWKDAETALMSLQKQFPNQLMVRDVGWSHEKRLICDDRFTFSGSFNLLSFSAERRGQGKIRHEGADLIQDAAFCEEMYGRYMKLFFGGGKNG